MDEWIKKLDKVYPLLRKNKRCHFCGKPYFIHLSALKGGKDEI